MVKVVIAPDSFKGSVSSVEAAQSLASGLTSILPKIETISAPMADGGEGTVDAILAVSGGEKVYRTVKDPLGRDVEAGFGWVEAEKLAVVETAAASGLPLVKPEERNPALASTYGTGQLIRAALDQGAQTLILGIGGSATVDAGAGCFQALGVTFLDASGVGIEARGGTLGQIAAIDTSGLDPRLQTTTIIVASDVSNPLLGNEGAIAVFGPQKGVRPSDIHRFEAGLAHYAEQVAAAVGLTGMDEPGSGAAGGFGFSLRSFLNAEMKSGFALIAERSRLEEQVSSADFVLTGEGKMDAQSLFGKVPVGVAHMARRHGVPTAVFAGRIEGEISALEQEGFSVFMPIVDAPMTLQAAMQNGKCLLYRAAQRFACFLKMQRET
jgi:glycerate kinase